LVVPYLQDAGLLPEEIPAEQQPWVRKLVEACHIKIATFADIVPYTDFLFRPIESYDEKGVRKHWQSEGAIELLTEYRDKLETLDPFSVETIENMTQKLADEREIGLGKVIHPVRLAVSGKTVGPGFFELFDLLGRDESLARLNKAIEYVRAMPAETEEESTL